MPRFLAQPIRYQASDNGLAVTLQITPITADIITNTSDANSRSVFLFDSVQAGGNQTTDPSFCYPTDRQLLDFSGTIGGRIELMVINNPDDAVGLQILATTVDNTQGFVVKTVYPGVITTPTLVTFSLEPTEGELIGTLDRPVYLTYLKAVRGFTYENITFSSLRVIANLETPAPVQLAPSPELIFTENNTLFSYTGNVFDDWIIVCPVPFSSSLDGLNDMLSDYVVDWLLEQGYHANRHDIWVLDGITTPPISDISYPSILYLNEYGESTVSQNLTYNEFTNKIMLDSDNGKTFQVQSYGTIASLLLGSELRFTELRSDTTSTSATVGRIILNDTWLGSPYIYLPASPTQANHVVNKEYVDSVVASAGQSLPSNDTVKSYITLIGPNDPITLAAGASTSPRISATFTDTNLVTIRYTARTTTAGVNGTLFARFYTSRTGTSYSQISSHYITNTANHLSASLQTSNFSGDYWFTFVNSTTSPMIIEGAMLEIISVVDTLQGIQGPQGATGPQGSTGPTGPAGEPAVSSFLLMGA